MVVSISIHKGWKVHHMNFKSAFLNDYLDEEVFVQ